MSSRSGVPEEIVPVIQRRIESGRWWIIPACSPDSFFLASAIECRFYRTPERGRQFDELVIRWPAEDVAKLWLFLAHKRWLSVSVFESAFAGVIERSGGPQADLLLTADLPASVRRWLRDTFRWGGVPNNN